MQEVIQSISNAVSTFMSNKDVRARIAVIELRRARSYLFLAAKECGIKIKQVEPGEASLSSQYLADLIKKYPYSRVDTDELYHINYHAWEALSVAYTNIKFYEENLPIRVSDRFTESDAGRPQGGSS